MFLLASAKGLPSPLIIHVLSFFLLAYSRRSSRLLIRPSFASPLQQL